MERTLESIVEVDDPYQAFTDSIKNSEIFRKYNNQLCDFLNLVPTSVYLEHLGFFELIIAVPSDEFTGIWRDLIIS